MDAIDKGSAGTDGGRDGAVGEEHEFFDQMMGFVGMLKVDFGRVAVFVEAEPHLVLLDGKGTIRDTLRTEFMRHFV